MLNKVAAFIKKMNMIQENDKVIVGISGGADSVCLLFVLLELQNQIPFTITGVHINHGIRREAATDEAFVRALCERQGVPCDFYMEDVKRIAAEKKMTEEEAGRLVRREAFEKTRERVGGNKIALAHHQNDNAETLLLNLARGTGLRGLCGILPVNDSYIRPLLCVSREEIELFLKERGIAYCVDKTNLSDDYTRNRIRNHVVSYLQEEVNPATVSHINATMRQLHAVQEYLDEQMHIYQEKCVKCEESGYIVMEDVFFQMPSILKPLLIQDLLATIAGQAKDIEAIHLKLVEELFEKQVGRQLDLPYEICAKKVYDGVWLGKAKIFPAAQEYVFLEPEQGVTKELIFKDMRISYTLLKKEETGGNEEENSGTKAFDYDIMNKSLVIRTRESGDAIFLGAGGTQKLKSFFVNQKIPQQQRGQIPLLVTGNQVLWIYGYRVDPRYRITEKTKTILKIRIEKENSYGRDNSRNDFRAGC